MVSIRSIAEIANVSRGTVDKVLNNRPGVSREVRERITKLAHELGYKPNLAGKALAFQKKDVQVGIIIPNMRDPFFKDIYEGVCQGITEFSKFGIHFRVLEMSQYSVEQQLACLREILGNELSGLIISPLDDENIRKKLLTVNRLRIPICTFNTDIAGIERLCYVGQNSKKSGHVAGDLMKKLLPKGGTVTCVTGSSFNTTLSDRLSGFCDEINSGDSKIKIDAILRHQDTVETAYEVTRDYLQSGKTVDAFFITSTGIDGMVQAIAESGHPKAKIICYDLINSTRKWIEKGLIDFTILQEPQKQGYLPIKILSELLIFEQNVDSEFQYTKIDIQTRASID